MTSSSSNPGRKRPLIVFTLIFLFALPCLWAGMMGDDYMHYAVLNAKNLPIEKPHDLSLFGLFSFIDGDPVRTREAMDLGVIPWWTYSGMKYAFWRPVSEISHWVDHELWPRSPPLMHLHSLLWYLGICAMLFLLYRRTLNPKVALLGLLLYGLDSTHGFALSWIANRNGLISTLFGLVSLYFYVRWREEQNLRWQLLSLVFLLTCLLSAELGISIYGYIGAYAITRDPRGKIKGCLSTLPHLVVILAWWWFYKHAGFGAANADAYYVDPAAEPLVFLSHFINRFPVLLASQWGIVPAEIYGFGLIHTTGFVIGSALFLLIILPVVIMAGVTDTNVRFWLLGMFFSLLPATTALPHDRVLIFTGIGASAVLAHFLHAVFRDHAQIRFIPTPIVKLIGGTLVLFHLILSPLLMPVMAYSPKIWSSQISQKPSHFPGISNIQSKRVVIFGAPLASALAIAPFRYYRQQVVPERIWVISSLDKDFQFKVIKPNQVQVRLPGGFIQGAESAVRDFKKFPFHSGDQVKLSGLDIGLDDLNIKGMPTTLTLTFDRPVSGSNILFLRWNAKDKAYKRIALNMQK